MAFTTSTKQMARLTAGVTSTTTTALRSLSLSTGASTTMNTLAFSSWSAGGVVGRRAAAAALGCTAPQRMCMSTTTDGAGATTASKTSTPHFLNKLKMSGMDQDYHFLPHPVYSEDVVKQVQVQHLEPRSWADRLPYMIIQTARKSFDIATGYSDHMGEAGWLRRILFLEAMAGVPPMVGAVCRHLSSIRKMRRDKGWIHSLLEEAENERMHLLTFLEIRKPSLFLRSFVLLGQGVMFNAYFLTYLVFPKGCHRFVGYLEEEAVKTYTKCIAAVEAGEVADWQTRKAPEVARKYWRLPAEATVLDVLYAVRVDETVHRDVNHLLAEVKQEDPNPVDALHQSAPKHNEVPQS